MAVTQNPIWLASYPRSGNTLLRTVLWQCFGLHSSSIYRNDLGGNIKLAEEVGHIERSQDGWFRFSATDLPLIKTHEYPPDNSPAIYIVRDGRAACVSLWKYYSESSTLESIIKGEHRFGTWSNHVKTWSPWKRKDTLLLRYEDLSSDLQNCLPKLKQFLNRQIIHHTIKSRDELVGIDGLWVKKKSDWRDHISKQELQLFDQINGRMMKKMGYA